MRLRAATLSFDSARVVELRRTLRVFLADRCHRILGAQIIFPFLQVALLGFPRFGLDLCPDIGLRWSFCAA